MTYKDFTLAEIKKRFGIDNKKADLFPDLLPIPPNEMLTIWLEAGFRQALLTEKERSEALIYPVLKTMQMRNNFRFQLYSGISLPADEENGLKGECDFILGGRGDASELELPLFDLVEAKQGDMAKHWGQIAAQLLGARIFNQKNDPPHPIIYGCLSTGEEWQFIKLEDDTFWIDKQKYFLKSEIDKILGILQIIIDRQM